MTKEYVIYYGTILLASFFAWLAQKFAKDKEGKFRLNKFWFILSMLTLSFTMGLRTIGVGVDDKSYERIFIEIKNNNFITLFLETKMEIGYLLLNQIFAFFTNDFQVVLYFITLITLAFYYKAIEYERKNVNYFLLVFLFGTIMYLYFFGIIRLFIATGIVAYAYRFIFEKNTKKYIKWVIIASLFHYSALFALIFIYFSTEKKEKTRSISKLVLITAIVLPIVMIAFSKLIIPILRTK